MWIVLLEDFFWFLLSPFYGLKKYFSPDKNIPWHKNLLTKNMTGIVFIILLLLLIDVKELWFTSLFIFVSIFIVIAFTPLYRLFYRKTHTIVPNKCKEIPNLK